MKFLIILGGLLSISVAAPSAFRWTDCSSDPNNKAVTVHTLVLDPSHVTFPGTVNVTINVTINRDINFLFIDTEIIKKGVLGDSKIPCIGTTNIGTCQNIDACTLLSKILNGSSVVSKSFGQQVDTILFAALGHHAQCPMHPEVVSVVNAQLTLNPIPALLATIANGNYHVKISVKDDPTSTENLGCIEFDAGLTRQGGFLLGG